MPKSCWAPQCNHTSGREPCSFFRFPSDKNVLKKWLNLLRRANDQPGPHSRVCSCHFKENKRENGPEISTHNVDKLFARHHLTPEKRKERTVRKPRGRRTSQTRLIDEASSSEALAAPLPFSDEEEDVEPQVVEEMMPFEPEPSTSGTLPASAKVTQESAVVLEADNYLLKLELERKDEIIKTLRLHLTYDHIKNNEGLLLEYTGLPTANIFESLAELLKNTEINYYAKWKVHKLNNTDQLLVTLMKLRNNFTHADLAYRFQVSTATITNIVVTYIHVLHELLYKQLMAEIPERSKNKSCLPNCCSTFTNCRIILDCTEIFSAVPRQSMETQKLTYSSYKHRNTWKGLVGVAPNGVITYVSDLYPGSSSDKAIVKSCGIVDQFEAGDLILADKGFLIEDLLPAGVSLNIPPFLMAPQFTPEEVRRTEYIARARIHVERAIQRMKCYKILNFIPQSLFSYGSIIFKTVGAITNLQYPLIKQVEQFYENNM